MFRFAIVFFACLVSACASLTTGRYQSVSIEAPDCPEASCVLTNRDGVFFVASAPGATDVNKACGTLRIKCSKAGYPDYVEDIPPSLQTMTFGNALVGGFIGAGVDAATGAACRYPKLIPIAMDCTEPPAANGDALAEPVPLRIVELARDHQCDEAAFVQHGDDGEKYFSARCEGGRRLITCQGHACAFNPYRDPSDLEGGTEPSTAATAR